jgi:hypothetical protein
MAERSAKLAEFSAKLAEFSANLSKRPEAFPLDTALRAARSTCTQDVCERAGMMSETKQGSA